jgi:hypothetical protein
MSNVKTQLKAERVQLAVDMASRRLTLKQLPQVEIDLGEAPVVILLQGGFILNLTGQNG